MTLMMRPSRPGPTGTAIGMPVSVTAWPRTRPSETSIAMVRTVDSPRCWATSSTSRLPLFVVSSAFRIAGRWPSNCTSTTAPMTWVIFPVAVAMWSSLPFRLSSRRFPEQRHRLECFSARDDLDQFLGDHRLARAVVNQSLLADHVAGIARRVVHGAHLRAVERCVVLKQRAEDLHREIGRQQLGEDLVLFRFVFVEYRRTRGLFLLDHQRDDLLRGRNLRDHRLEARVEQRADVELAGIEHLDDRLGDVLGVLVAKYPHRAQLGMADDLLFEVAAQLLKTLAADAVELDL